jgi:lysyl-tRNA synthetase class 2
MDVSTISLTTVKSSNINKLGYDATRKILVVEFHSGKRYAHKDVPEDVFDALKDAPSIGGYFAKNIKNAYAYEFA